MILYDLICDSEHQFESWFKNSTAAERLIKAGQVSCPTCESTKVKKALQAPNIPKKGAIRNAPAVSKKKSADVAGAMEKMTQAINELRQTIEKNFDNVGKRFPEEARRIHYGEAKERGIFGEASPQEAKDLVDEGIKIYALPLPKRKDA